MSDSSPSRPYRLLVRLSGIALGVYWVALFLSTHLPHPPGEEYIQGNDKQLHFMAFLGLTFLLVTWLTFRNGFEVRQYLYAAVIAAVYAVVDELLQIPVGRHADLWDAVADWTGVGLGLAAHLTLLPLLTRLRPATENSTSYILPPNS